MICCCYAHALSPPPQTKLGRVADSPPTKQQQPSDHPDKGGTPRGQEVGVEEAGLDSDSEEEEEEPDEYAGLPLWRKALLKKRAEEQRKKEEEREKVVGVAALRGSGWSWF